MKKSMKDPKNPSVTISVEVPNPPDRSGRYVTKCEKCGKPISGKKAQEYPVCKVCRFEEVMSRIPLVCKDCGKDFYVKKEKADMLISLGFSLPVRCYDCHMKRKGKREG